MRLSFTKMHGAGNDFMLFDRLDAPLPTPGQWRVLSDRHRGIGFDQAVVFEPASSAEVASAYRIFNADGSEAEQSGNGVRCAMRLLHLQGRSRGGAIALTGAAGLIRGRVLDGDRMSVDMGPPRFDPAALPFIAPAEAMSYPIDIEGRSYEIGAASMGNPHAVLRVTDVESAPVEAIGRALQQHPRFPKRVNAGFMQIANAHSIRLRVYERGAGETLACGTGACAAVAVGRLQGLLAADVEVHVPGGQLGVHWDGGDAPVWLSGPAAVAFTGQIDIE